MLKPLHAWSQLGYDLYSCSAVQVGLLMSNERQTFNAEAKYFGQNIYLASVFSSSFFSILDGYARLALPETFSQREVDLKIG